MSFLQTCSHRMATEQMICLSLPVCKIIQEVNCSFTIAGEIKFMKATIIKTTGMVREFQMAFIITSSMNRMEKAFRVSSRFFQENNFQKKSASLQNENV